jgi:hypothetical protein
MCNLLWQDYIGGEEDEGGHPVVTSPKRKRKGAFISGTVDIDVLLGKVSFSNTTFYSSGSQPFLSIMTHILRMKD